MVIVAAITAAPSLVAALVALAVRRDIRTPSGDTIGSVAEKAHHTGIANNLLLRKLNGLGDTQTEEGS